MAAHSQLTLLDEERDFHLHELFFSTTDSKGVIRHGNDVFARVAGMSLDILVGSPHSIIRHPEMPRAVFRLFWNFIQKGSNIAAYVKNLASDGRYYWVLALAMPCEDGYLSVRMKPSSELLPLVKGLYDQMLVVERAIETEPKQRVAAMNASEELLRKQLLELGYRTYEEFMLNALSSELRSRSSKLLVAKPNGSSRSTSTRARNDSDFFKLLVALHNACQTMVGELNVVFDQLDSFKFTSVQLQNDSAIILHSADAIRYLSMNAKIAAKQTGKSASTLLVVAEALGAVSNQNQAVIGELALKMQAVIAVLNQLMFDVAATKLQCEVSLYFLDELVRDLQDGPDEGLQSSLVALVGQIFIGIDVIFKHLRDTASKMGEMQTQITKLERNNRTLRFVEFSGKKEASSTASEFGVVFQEVSSHIESTTQKCDCLLNSIEVSLSNIRALQSIEGRLSNSLSVLRRVDLLRPPSRERKQQVQSSLNRSAAVMFGA